MNVDKIIFLDIDGPVIPGHLSTPATVDFVSFRRSKFCVQAIDRLNHLCEDTGAKIVTNSMQNYVDIGGNTLHDDLTAWGLDPQHTHSDCRTIFPNVDYKANPNPRKGWGRWLGILDWQERNGTVNWVCFDDRNFTDDPRLILIDFYNGITDQDVLEARVLLDS